jgi:hypothetical protein
MNWFKNLKKNRKIGLKQGDIYILKDGVNFFSKDTNIGCNKYGFAVDAANIKWLWKLYGDDIMEDWKKDIFKNAGLRPFGWWVATGMNTQDFFKLDHLTSIKRLEAMNCIEPWEEVKVSMVKERQRVTDLLIHGE